MKKFYLYKMTVDNGGAPCVQDRILSLAICKPRIRSSALKEAEEAILLGFAAKQLRSDNRLILYRKGHQES
jgi:Nucleotide modification associated domain 2